MKEEKKEKEKEKGGGGLFDTVYSKQTVTAKQEKGNVRKGQDKRDKKNNKESSASV